jgi:Uncharacterized conserved protein
MTSRFRILLTLTAAVLASAAAAQDLVHIPAGAQEVTDQITTLKVRVSISEFLLGATEVTQSDYEAITSANPSVYKGGSRPVENVSWWDAIRYCNRRSEKENLPACYDLATGRRDPACIGYRLPTEAEWILAAGSKPGEQRTGQPANLGASSTKTVGVLDEALKKGTMPVRSFPPNSFGLFDMRGNVWEWCGDYFDALASPDSIRDPSGPASGVARVIHGGSFASTTSRWSRDYRSSMSADSRSRFTGFRVARSLNPKSAPPAASEAFFRPYNQAPEGFSSSIGPLTALSAPGGSAESWKANAAKIRSKWDSLLKEPTYPGAKLGARLVRDVSQRNFSGQMFELEMEPGFWEKIYILRPSAAARGPRPVMIVPFYDVDTPAAADLGGRSYTPDRGTTAFAYAAAQRGYIAVAVRWFGESYGESSSEAVANLALRNPGATGLGKWVADARRVVDFIETLPDADAHRIGIIGHSLGGKMALYAAAFEPRIRATVSSELGVGFKFSNYEDYWYLGDKILTLPPGTDQHELIALVAPRPFLLIGGDEYDKKESWYYINAARAVYDLLGHHDNVGYFNHHTGHTPSPQATSLAFDWLDRFLNP